MACCWTNSKKWSPDRLGLLLHVGDFDGLLQRRLLQLLQWTLKLLLHWSLKRVALRCPFLMGPFGRCPFPLVIAVVRLALTP